MKLYRFTALDSQRTMNKINDVLGPEALIYSTRKIPYGIEMIAGPPYDKKDDDITGNLELESGESNRELIDKLNIQLQYMNESIHKLTTQIVFLHSKNQQTFYKRLLLKMKNLFIFPKKTLKEGVYEGQSLR